MTKACSCGFEGCPVLAPGDGHAWDPLAEPVDDCVLCGELLDLMPPPQVERPRELGPPRLPVQVGSGYAHAECC